MSIDNIEKDIQNLNIQGATNVAIATLEGMKVFLETSKEEVPGKILDEFVSVGKRLSTARPNEPLAQNAVRFISYKIRNGNIDLHNLEVMKQKLDDYSDEYLKLISDSKKSIIEKCTPYLRPLETVLTHCHSSTAISMIKSIAQGKDSFNAICTETRPLYQGRVTARNLLDAGISTTMIVDSAAESFVIGRGSKLVDAVLIGCDVITMKGHCVNKIGSWGIGMAAYYSERPLYVVSPILKMEPRTPEGGIKIEIREDRELWTDAPKGLDIYNPAFEFVDNRMITGFLTEFGIVKPNEIGKIAQEKYPWLFNE